MCGENMCWNCEEYVDPNTHRCFMKPIKLADDSREKRKKATKKHNRRRGSNELLDDSSTTDLFPLLFLFFLKINSSPKNTYK